MPGADEREDIEQVKQVKTTYCTHLDARNVDALVDLFTDDAICEFEAVFGSATDGRWEGKPAIRRQYQDKWGAAGAPWTSIHAVTNAVVSVDGDTATGRYYLLDYLITPGRDPLVLLGMYDEDYRRENGVWRICRSRIDVFYNTSPRRGLPVPART